MGKEKKKKDGTYTMVAVSEERKRRGSRLSLEVGLAIKSNWQSRKMFLLRTLSISDGIFLLSMLCICCCVYYLSQLYHLDTVVRSLLSPVYWLLLTVVKFLTRCLREGCS